MRNIDPSCMSVFRLFSPLNTRDTNHLAAERRTGRVDRKPVYECELMFDVPPFIVLSQCSSLHRVL